MDSKKLQELIRQPEGLKLDFKREFYKIDHPDKRVRKWQWDEFIKDILALANGNVGVAAETAYLIIGVENQLKADGTRDLYDVGDVSCTRQQILEKVNSACSPPLPDAHCDTVVLEEHSIFVVSIPPSPHLHETTRRLATPSGTAHPESTVFIRRGEGTFPATIPERRAIEADKRDHSSPQSHTPPHHLEPQPAAELGDIDWKVYRDALPEQLTQVTHLGQPLDEVIPRRVGIGNQTRPWLEAATEKKGRLGVLLSDPGEGKTICMKQLAAQLLDEYERPPGKTKLTRPRETNRPLPVLVRLIEYDPHRQPLTALIAGAFQQCGLTDVTEARVRQILGGEQPLIVLTDGLDEASDRRSLVKELNSLRKVASGTRFIVSCRKASFEELRELVSPDVCWELVSLDEKEVKSFLKDHLEDQSWSGDTNIVEVLRTPFFLSVFAYLYTDAKAQLQTRFELCQAFVNELHKREFKHLGRDSQQALDAWQRALDTVASEMRQAQVSHLSTSHFDEVATDVWRSLYYGGETSVPKDKVLNVLHRLPLVKEHTGNVSFSHSLFQDFFAARWLKSKPELLDPQAFRRYATNPQWNQAIVLLAGSMPGKGQVLENLVYANADHDLVAHCLLETRRVRQDILASAINYVLQSGPLFTPLILKPLLPRLPSPAREVVAEALDKAYLLLVAGGSNNWVEVIEKIDGKELVSGLPVTKEMARQVVAKGLKSSNELERIIAIRLAAILGQWDKVVGFVNDSSSWVRGTIQIIIVGVSEESKNDHIESLVGVLDQMVKDPDDDVRYSAIEHLGQIDHQAAGDALVRWLSQKDKELSIRAAIALGKKWGDDRAVVRLLDAIELDETLAEPPGYYEDTCDLLLDVLQSINTPLSGEAILFCWLSDLIGVDPEWAAWVLTRRKDPRAMIVMLAETPETRSDYEPSDWYLEMKERGEWLSHRAASRAIIKQGKADSDHLYWLIRGMLLMDFFYCGLRDCPLIDVVLFELVRIDPTILVDLALGKLKTPFYFSEVVVYESWEKIGALFSTLFSLVEGLVGEKGHLFRVQLREALRQAITPEVGKDLENFDPLGWLEG